MGNTSAKASAVWTAVHPEPAAAKQAKSEDSGVERREVVKGPEVINRRGPLSFNSRYVRTRELHADFRFDNKVLGCGRSGPVQLASKGDRKYAIKSFKKQGLTFEQIAEMENEANIYLTLDHPHIARLEMVYESDEDLHLVMECMEGGELHDRLTAKLKYHEQDAANTIFMMLLAVKYLHERNVVHRDLKLENFLYEAKETDYLKLVDFGLAKHWDHRTNLTQACGSMHYIAPEVLNRSYTEKADMWSIGVIAYMLLTGSSPWGAADKTEAIRMIRRGSYLTRDLEITCSDQAREFISELLTLDTSRRLSASTALEHPFIASRTSTQMPVNLSILHSLHSFCHASHFRRACLSMMAWCCSCEERSELRDQFIALDTTKSGTITLEELQQVLDDELNIDCEQAEKLFTKLDFDGDHEIAYTEFLAACLHDRDRLHQDLLRDTFERFDADGAGEITADKLRAVLGDSFEGKTVEELLVEADFNCDARLTFDEFVEYLTAADVAENTVPEARIKSTKVGPSLSCNGIPPDQFPHPSVTVENSGALWRVQSFSTAASIGSSHSHDSSSSRTDL
eukprot:gnl/TRDRNA2_/TRDRNA2_177909_c0_seq4.p1 gnl/TRDRNA2_/TRDRNA2_177909_c0~~gnl/TRDRNA2_/TRDRNA2_177909_c0_seq4.p1  ORF type:complete len:569 (+),score=95.24 gnl/TRDRNA2_/TRDRNA2_177909_c0_seq4:104-1810(+)